MKRNVLITILMCATIAVAGCATHGATALKDETKVTVREKLVAGKTTKDEVVAMYGQPQNIKKTKSGETYVYVLSKTRSGNLFRPLDMEDANNAATGAAAGVLYGDASVGAAVAGGFLAAGRLGSASNKSDQTVDKSLIVKFNKRGIVTSHSLN